MLSIILSSCSDEKENRTHNNISEDNTSEMLNPISESEIKVTIKDYLEEAMSMKLEAEEIIIRADEINCAEAKKIAENVLLISGKAESSSNLLRVEHYIEEASQTLSNAEDAIIYCEEKNEISYASALGNEE